MNEKTKEVEKIRQAYLSELHDIYSPGEIRQIFFMLCENWKGWSQAQLQLNRNVMLDEHDIIRFDEALAKLLDFVPIQYIIGTSSFLDLELNVTPATLIPRPETEELATHIMETNRHRQFEDLSILDIGTGTGCLAITLARFFKGAKVWATDVSEEALKVAKENATRYEAGIRFLQNDILDPDHWDIFPGFDILVSNPPYVTESEKAMMKRNVMDHEPPSSLFVPGNDPLIFYRALARIAQLHLLQPGMAYFEINEQFGPEVRQLLQEHGFENVNVMKDLSGKDRFVSAEMNFRPLDTSYWHVEH